MAKPIWKVTITTRWLFSPKTFHNPTVKTRVFRWRWRARWEAFMVSGFSRISTTYAEVEPYWPSENIVPLKRRA